MASVEWPVTVRRRGGAFTVESARGDQLHRALAGKAPASIRTLLPLLFAVCGQAHQAAFDAAVAAARDVAEGARVAEGAAPAVRAEAMAETVRTLALDLGKRVVGAPLGAADTALVLQALQDRTGGGESAARWLRGAGRVLSAIEAAYGQLPAAALPSSCLLLPAALRDAETLAGFGMRALREEGFSRRPELGGARVVGAAARNPAGCVTPAAMVAARVAELRAFAEGRLAWPAPKAVSPEAGVGVALVETARGPLVYAVRLDPRGTVAACAAVAPTEWAFRPGSALEALLAECVRLRPESGEALARTVRMVAAAFDPCTALVVDLRDKETCDA